MAERLPALEPHRSSQSGREEAGDDSTSRQPAPPACASQSASPQAARHTDHAFSENYFFLSHFPWKLKIATKKKKKWPSSLSLPAKPSPGSAVTVVAWRIKSSRCLQNSFPAGYCSLMRVGRFCFLPIQKGKFPPGSWSSSCTW